MKLLCQVCTMIVDHQLKASNFKMLLEAKNGIGMTPLLIACLKKNYALIELLVENGTNLKSTDEDGNTAIILALSRPSEQDIKNPFDEFSQEIFKVFINLRLKI